MRGVIVIAAIGGSLLACAPKERLPEARVVRQAPASKIEAGILVTGAKQSQIHNLIEKYPTSIVRPIYENRGIYEIHGLSLSETKSNFPSDIGISKNRYFRSAAPSSQKTWRRVGPRAGNDADAFDKFITECTEYKSETGPFEVKSQISKKDPYRKTRYLELGQKLDLQVSATDGDAWSFVWIAAIPELSSLNFPATLGDSIELKPDQVGVYKAFVVGRNSKGICYNTTEQLFVSANPAFIPNHGLSSEEKNKFSFVPFWHLDEMHALPRNPNLTGENIVIAVIDTGLNYNHPYINENVFLNTAEVPDNGIDDDGNGLIDDYVGYDFANSDSQAFDDEGHGSHVSGLAASFVGIAPKAKILPIKAFNPLGMDMGSVVAAVYYAVDRGANVINASFGWETDFPEFRKAIEYAKDHNVVVVAAAGNGDASDMALNNDETPSYPANYDYENIISVTALDAEGKLPFYANYGPKTVHFAAIGGSSRIPLISLATQNSKNILTASRYATSMSAALVSGGLALVMQKSKSLNAHAAIQKLIDSGVSNPELTDFTISGKALDLEKLYSQDLGLACN